MSKLTDGAFNKGKKAAQLGKPRMPPYGIDTPKDRRGGGTTFRKGAINAWLRGYDSGTPSR